VEELCACQSDRANQAELSGEQLRMPVEELEAAVDWPTTLAFERENAAHRVGTQAVRRRLIIDNRFYQYWRPVKFACPNTWLSIAVRIALWSAPVRC
jgi:hypothetical protein